jgi:signal transduction histidine kinase
LLSTRKISTPTEPELVQGLPLFLDQLAASISAKQDDVGGMRGQMRASATLHGAQIEVVATIEAKDRDIRLTVDLCPPDVIVDADSEVLASVVANLVQYAFKFTKAQGHITLRARSTGDRVLIEVEDECGGLPPGKIADLFHPYGQRGPDQTGLGLGLAISLKGVQANGGQIHVRDIAGRGCVLTVEMPKSPIA